MLVSAGFIFSMVFLMKLVGQHPKHNNSCIFNCVYGTEIIGGHLYRHIEMHLTCKLHTAIMYSIPDQMHLHIPDIRHESYGGISKTM